MRRLTLTFGRAAGALLVASLAIAACNDYDDYGYGVSGRAPPTFPSAPRPAQVVAQPSRCASAKIDAPCRSVDISYGETCEEKLFANVKCNSLLRCDSTGYWAEDESALPCAVDCPSAYVESVDSSRCGPPGDNVVSLLCEYPEGTCGCAPVYADGDDAGAEAGAKDAGDAAAKDSGSEAGAKDGGADGGDEPGPEPIAYTWRCVKPEAGCPRTRPRIGDSCVVPMACDYGSCVFPEGVTMRCSGKEWTVEEVECGQ